ncbi:MAG: BACON domain-containing carbohydrate-binding protein, partial [Acidobacteriota bacterium]
CAWSATTVDSWITITTGGSLGDDSDGGASGEEAAYSVSANSTGQQRVGEIVVAGKIFTVIQDPSP